MKYGSVCSGVEAASLAWEPLGWQPQWFSEIDKFPSAVLQHHWPDVPNLGDMTSNEFKQKATPVDLIVGGTPCQSFSVAGLRKGLDDQNGNLALEFCRLIDRATPKWFVWENVPGVLSSNKGRDFGSIVGAMAEIGYNVAWRILDAQHFGTPQRRRRIFLVGHIGADGREAAAVLFESHSLQGHSAPSREKGQNVAPAVTSGAPFSRTGNEVEADAIVPVMQHNQIVGPVTARKGRNAGASNGDVTANHLICVNAREDPIYLSGKDLPLGALDRGHAIATPMQVRRLTPRECERLQGMPDDHTRIPWRNKPAEDCPDTPRYKAIGNSMAVPVMRWIGQRIDLIDTIYNE
jgi:DNA (cytosine-5)-methyltransferase 1